MDMMNHNGHGDMGIEQQHQKHADMVDCVK